MYPTNRAHKTTPPTMQKRFGKAISSCVGGFKSQGLEWSEHKLGNQLPEKDGLNTSFFIATEVKACPLGEPSLSRLAFAARQGARQPRNANHASK